MTDKKFNIQTLNNIAKAGLERYPADGYEVGEDVENPDALMLRSAKIHDMEIPDSLLAVGRAGAGVNNIPVDRMSDRGIPVFNAPGANANAVKELVVAGMLLAARHICDAWHYVRELEGDEQELTAAVESGKKRYRGFELPGRSLGVVGLGAIGVKVANAARSLGMKVQGVDPHITVEGAWELSADVAEAASLEDLYRESEFISFHVPLNDGTRGLLNDETLEQLRPGCVVMNFSRAGIVDEAAIIRALDAGRVAAYVTDFPSGELKRHPNVICLPHLGASTQEAEENCAVMVADQLRDYLENGNIRNAVNFPRLRMKRGGEQRLCVANYNRPDMIGQLSHALGQAGINIVHMRNESQGDVAYNLIDVEPRLSDDTLKAIEAIEGVLRVRVLD
jgi:D-3-phosphoglycerate dehydrogenase